MTTTDQKRQQNGSPAASAELRPAVVMPPRGRRRPVLVLVGAVLVTIGALAVIWLVSSAGDRRDVVVLARDVTYGTTLTGEDLTTAAVAVEPGVQVVLADQAPNLVGQVLTADLPRGAVLAPGSVTPGGVIADGEVLVPVAMPSTRLPAGGLHAGDRLLIVDAPPEGADPLAQAPTPFAARVVRMGAPDVNGVVVVDVVTASGDGPSVATRAATGRFAIVVQPAQEQP